MSEQRGFDETKDTGWLDEVDTGFLHSPTIQRNIGPSSRLPPLMHPSTCVISPRSPPPLGPPISRGSSVLPILDSLTESNAYSPLLPRTWSRHEVQSPRPLNTARKRKRVTPTPVSDSSNLGQSQPDLAKEVGQILMLLARASVRVSRLSPLQNSFPPNRTWPRKSDRS